MGVQRITKEEILIRIAQKNAVHLSDSRHEIFTQNTQNILVDWHITPSGDDHAIGYKLKKNSSWNLFGGQHIELQVDS